MSALDRAFLWAWWLNVLGLPYYVFPSGRPQPADFALVATATVPALLGFPTLLRSAGGVTSAVAAFVGVVVAVNLAWTALMADSEFLVSTAFYVFNGTVFLGMLWHGLRLGEAFARTTAHATLVSLVLHVAFAFAFPGRNVSGRLTLFFNNPNQLAYYALGAATVVAIVAVAQPRLRFWSVIAIAAAAFITYRTYSRAAALGVGALALVWLLRRPALGVVLVGPMLLAGGLADLDLEADVFWQARIAQAVEGDPSDYLEDRGLERIVEHPEHLLLGAGEGRHDRFHTLGLELHSSLANVAFSYGLFGVLTFALLVGRTFSASARRAGLMLFPSLFYSLFHNGLRFRVFWVVLAIAVVCGLQARDAGSRSGSAAAR